MRSASHDAVWPMPCAWLPTTPLQGVQVAACPLVRRVTWAQGIGLAADAGLLPPFRLTALFLPFCSTNHARALLYSDSRCTLLHLLTAFVCRAVANRPPWFPFYGSICVCWLPCVALLVRPCSRPVHDVCAGAITVFLCASPLAVCVARHFWATCVTVWGPLRAQSLHRCLVQHVVTAKFPADVFERHAGLDGLANPIGTDLWMVLLL